MAGVGFRAAASAAEIAALVRTALHRAALNSGRLSRLATLDERAAFPAFGEAADNLGVSRIAVSPEALRAVADRVVTRSPAILARYGVGSVAEAAALAAAGPGSRLVLPRIGAGTVTCALAEEANP